MKSAMSWTGYDHRLPQASQDAQEPAGVSEMTDDEVKLKFLLRRRHITEKGCWYWTGTLTGPGYGSCSYMGVRWAVHRLAWALSNGKPIPEGMVVMHSCDNPCCFNPAHLSAGTQLDNIRDAFAKGKGWMQQPSEEFMSKPSAPVEGPLLLRDLFKKYEVEYLPELSKRTQRDYRGILAILGEKFRHLQPKELKPRQIVEFLNVDKGRVHRNRMVSIVSSVYRKAIGKWCVDDELTNPCTAVEKWPTKPRTRYVTDDEFKRFREMCCEQVQIAMDLALLTGQRQGDLIGLTWDQIHAIGVPRDKWFIEVKQGKTGKHLGIKITPAIEAVLSRAKMMPPNYPHDWVIRTEHGYPYTDDGFRAMWQRYCRKWQQAGNERFHFHDLRAKSISDNVDLDAAYLLAGHIDIKMTRRVYDRNIRMVNPLR